MKPFNRWWIVGVMPLALVGCAPLPPWPEPERQAAGMIGSRNPIAVDLVGGPLDAPGTVGEHLPRADALARALMTSPVIQAELARVRLALAAAHQERLLPNPVLTVVLKIPTSGGAPIVEPSIAADLLALLQKPGKVEAADHRLRATSAEALVAVLTVLAQVEEGYAQVQALEALLPVLNERRRLNDHLLTIAQSRLNRGEGTRLDVTTLQAQQVELDVEIVEQQLETREARLELARLIGLPSDAATWRVEGWAEPTEVRADEQAWVRAGLEHRPEIAARTWELQALGVELRQARWWALQGAEVGVAAEGTAESGADDWAVGPSLAIPLPLFDWGQAKRESLAAQRSLALHDLTQVRRQVVEDVRRAHAACRAALDARSKVRRQLIPLLERRRADAESQYRAGQSDIIPLILADQDLQTARAKLVELERKSATSFARLRRAVGGASALPAAATQPALTSIPTTQPH